MAALTALCAKSPLNWITGIGQHSLDSIGTGARSIDNLPARGHLPEKQQIMG
jgi:hypothetical protein